VLRADTPAAASEYVRIGHHRAAEQITAGSDYLEIRPLIDVLQAEGPGTPEVITHGEFTAPVTGYLYVLAALAQPADSSIRWLRTTDH
jgi:hypothetical protein